MNLNNVRMDQEILTFIPHEVAERSTVVPLGEKGGAIYVAMLDAQNVQSTDYLSTLVQKPVRTVMASEVGLRAALAQYTGDFSAVQNAVKTTNQEVAQKKASADVKTITQDSPISKALATILDYAAKQKHRIFILSHLRSP